MTNAKSQNNDDRFKECKALLRSLNKPELFELRKMVNAELKGREKDKALLINIFGKSDK